MKKLILMLSLLSVTVLLLFPSTASAAPLESYEDDLAVTSIQREASIKHRADQRYYYDPAIGWGGLTNIIYRDVWFTNGIEELGYHQIALKRGLSFDTYTWQWSYRIY